MGLINNLDVMIYIHIYTSIYYLIVIDIQKLAHYLIIELCAVNGTEIIMVIELPYNCNCIITN